MKKLIFVTSKYPFSNGETFIENEIKYLAQGFDKIYIYATEASGREFMRSVPENVIAFAANPKNVTVKDYPFSLVKPSVIKEIFKNCIANNVISRISAVCWFDSNVSASMKNADAFIEKCDLSKNDIITVYSYWLSTIGMCAVMINDKINKMGIKTRLVSRCHGFDVYAERGYSGFIPFQKYSVNKFESIYPCSKQGTEYLKRLYPKQKDKICYKYLGVEDLFNKQFPLNNTEEFSIVSCSNVIPLKRVDKIAEALSKIKDKKIKWTHFGDGELLEDIKKQANSILPDNITVEFKGRIPNSEIYGYYNDNNVNLFINVSTSEGLPVSIMEASSFGIPIIATDVGGTGELVKNGENGFLIKCDFEIEELFELICKFIDMPSGEYKTFCEKSREIYEKDFCAEKNYTEFCKEISF